MSSIIEIFDKIYENKDYINDINESYYHIAAATYDAWIGSENILEKNLAQRLQKIMINILVDDIEYNYSKTKYSENRLEYYDYFMNSLRVYTRTHTDNLLIKDAIGNISLSNSNYVL
jgi:hypothetical protein